MRTYQIIAIDYDKYYCLCPNVSCRDHIHIYPNKYQSIIDHYVRVKSLCKCDLNKHCDLRIDETTYRISLTYYNNRSITFSKRKFKNQKKIHEPTEVKEGYFKKRYGNFIIDFK